METQEFLSSRPIEKESPMIYTVVAAIAPAVLLVILVAIASSISANT